MVNVSSVRRSKNEKEREGEKRERKRERKLETYFASRNSNPTEIVN